MSDHLSVWRNCLETIRNSVNNQSFKTWFEPIKPVRLDNNTLTIQVPNKFFYEYLDEQYWELLKRTVTKELGDKARLEYQFPINTSEQPSAKTGNKKGNGPAVSSPIDGSEIKNPFVIPGIRRFKIEPELNPNYIFDRFIEGDCNRLARSAGVAIARNPGGTAFNPLVVYGQVGLGKTHLAQAIGNDIVRQHENKNIVYVSAEKFTNQIIQAIKNNAVDDFQNFYHLVDVLIMDDIQFLAGKQKMQEIFFHIFNQLHQSGKQIVITSDRPPKDLAGMEERLISRFKWGLTADLTSPDFETRFAILQKKADMEGIEIPFDVAEFVCYNIKDNIRELEGVLISLIAQSSLNKKKIDMDLAKEVVQKFVKKANREITLEGIQKLVAEHFDIPAEKLMSPTRKRNIVIARQLSMYLAKNLTNKSLKIIGEQLGGKDHSTVIYSCKAVQDLMDTDKEFKDTVTELEKKVRMSVNAI